MLTPYDMVVIGSGPAGESAAVLAAQFGHRVAMIERAVVGGTPVTRGGAPTKTLREATMALTGYFDHDVYGVDLGAPPALALDKLAERTRAVCVALQAAARGRINTTKIDLVHGAATLLPGGGVRVALADGTSTDLACRVVLLANGSRPARPDGIPFDDPMVFDVDQIYSLKSLPARMFIVGGGPIGVEFATIFSALGVAVTLAQGGDRIAPTMDGELSQAMQRIFHERGVEVLLGASVAAVARSGERLTVSLADGWHHFTDSVFFAAGRTPNTDGLGLAEAAVATDARGFVVADKAMRTSVAHVFAAGDIAGPGLSSVAMEQGRVAACHALGIDFLTHVDPVPISAVYGMPEMAGVGMTEEQCRQQGIDYAVGRCALSTIPRGAISGHDGLLKLIFSRDDHMLLGVHCIGEVAAELIGAGQMAIHHHAKVDVFSVLTLPTPTYAYAYKNAAFDGLRRLM
jgi:NAD(P) transhydrogenase